MKRAAVVFVLALSMTLPALAQETSPAAKYFSGLQLVDQNGRTVDLYALMKGRTIGINTFFATCSGSCPVMGRTFAALQDQFGEHMGKDLVLVSITVDPVQDTPAKLKAYAKGMKARDGWYFLTGSREQVDAALKKLGQYVESPDQHMNVMIFGNEKTGLWKKAFGLAKTSELAVILSSVLNDDGTTPVATFPGR